MRDMSGCRDCSAKRGGGMTAYELDPSNGRGGAERPCRYARPPRHSALVWFEKATRRETQPLYADNIGDAWADLGITGKRSRPFRQLLYFARILPVGPLGLSALTISQRFQFARKQCDDTRKKYENSPQPLIVGLD